MIFKYMITEHRSKKKKKVLTKTLYTKIYNNIYFAVEFLMYIQFIFIFNSIFEYK